MEGEERVSHADDTDRPAVDLDDAATVATYVLDRPDTVLHLTSSDRGGGNGPQPPIDLLSMAPTRRAVERHAPAEEPA
jgi:hypothetical protein